MVSGKSCCACAVRFLMCFCATLACFGQHPVNDDLFNPMVLVGNSITFTGQLAGSTYQIQDPNPGLAGLCQNGPIRVCLGAPCGSIWWQWTAETATPVVIEALELSHFDLKRGGLDVFSGTNASWDWCFQKDVLRIAPETSFDTGRRPYVSFMATAGTDYHIRAIGCTGTVTLRLTATNDPVIVIQPRTQTVSLGGSVYFGVGVAGIAPYTYQWRFNSNDLPTETFAILSLDHLTGEQAGEYSVVVSNATGRVFSEPARLFVSVSDVQPLLSALPGVSTNAFWFTLTGETGRSYRVESSGDLKQWLPETSLPTPLNYFFSQSQPFLKNGIVINTNGNSPFMIPAASRSRFLRVRRYDPPDAVHNNNLKKMRFAAELWALEKKRVSTDTPVDSDWFPYLKSGFASNCPGGGWYVPHNMSENPVCVTDDRYPLEEPTY